MTEIFVFGSNLLGLHGAGAAKHARKHYGASYGIGEGRTGNAYAIPTKGREMEVLSLTDIRLSVWRFVTHACLHNNDSFLVTPIGTGLAGYARWQIAPMFDHSPDNCFFQDEHGRDWRPGC